MIIHNSAPMATMILATARVNGSTGYAQQIATANHQLTSDEPVGRGGTNTGPAPFELMLSSLGACTAITMRMYAERKQWNLGTIDIQLRLLRNGDEAPRIERRIALTEHLEEEQLGKLKEIADKTPVTRALAPGVAIQTVIEVL